MHSKMLRKCRRLAAAVFAGAMIFGSIPVMAEIPEMTESESIQAAELERKVEAKDMTTQQDQKTKVWVYFETYDDAGVSVPLPRIEIEKGKSFKEAGISLPEPPKSFGEFVGWEDHSGNLIDENSPIESDMRLRARYDKCWVEFYIFNSEEEANSFVLANATKYVEVVDYGEKMTVPSALGDYENLVYVKGSEKAGDVVEMVSPKTSFYAWGTKKGAEIPKEEPVFTTYMTSWDGKEELAFEIDTKDGAISEFSYEVFLTSGDTVGGAYNWKDNAYNIDENGMGKGAVIFRDKLEAFCEKQGVDPAEVEKVEFVLAISYEDGSETAVKRISLPIVVYEPTATLTSGTWTGDNDIVIEVQGKGGDISVEEMYYQKDKFTLGGVKADVDIQVDENGNGTITLKNDALKNATTFTGSEYVKLDWTKADQLEIDVSFSYKGQYEGKFIYVPVAYKEAADVEEEPTTITDNSGVSMVLPSEAPKGLSLKVSESNGAEEKGAVSKLVQVEGDRIKTFDLSLLLDGKVWEYHGQFKSQVTLPAPEGWDLDALALYYFDEAANTAAAVPFTVDKGSNTITFETDHFSRYVLVQKAVWQGGLPTIITPVEKPAEKPTEQPAKQPNTSTTNVPETGDETNVVLYISILLVAGAAIVVSARKKMHN